LGNFSPKFLILFAICVRFEKCCGRFIAVRFHEIVSFVRTFLIIVKRKSASTFPSQSFRSDWAVATGGVFDPFKEACFPNISKPAFAALHLQMYKTRTTTMMKFTKNPMERM